LFSIVLGEALFLFKNCPECGGITSKFSAETFVCMDQNCRHIEAEQLYRMLKNLGVEGKIIKKVQDNILENTL
jgi:hypothetical protein